jgi:acetyltransferase
VFFGPEAVAVFGASQDPGSVGRVVMANLLRSPFGGAIYPITPKWPTVHGVHAYPRLADVPAPVDLAILATPAAATAGVLEECAAAGVRGAVILADGFHERDPARADLHAWIKDPARRGLLRVLGPNSMGVAFSGTGFNATFAPASIPPGRIGFVSQSGSVLAGLTSGGLAQGAGCSTFISVGSLIDVGWADCIRSLGADPLTACIAIYVESVGDPQAFVDAVRSVAAEKPVIAAHGGRTAAGARAAAAHNGSHPTRYEIAEEALRHAGVIRVGSLDELFRMAEVLGSRPTLQGWGGRLALLTNAGGPAVMATDALVDEGGELAELAPETVAELDQLAPHRPGRRNPIDLGDDATPELFVRAAEIAVRDPNSDGLLVILAPQASMDPVETTRALVPAVRRARKPVLASWLWGAATPASLTALHQGDIPTFSCPNAAARAFGCLARHGANIRGRTEASP